MWLSLGRKSVQVYLFPSAVSKPSCSFLGKPKKQQQTEKTERGREGRKKGGGERERKESRGLKLQVGWRFYLHLQPLSHKYPGRHSWHLAPVVPSLHLQYPVPLQRSVFEPKGLQLQSVETRHTHTHSGETGSVVFSLSDQLMNKIPLFSTQKAFSLKMGLCCLLHAHC